MRAGGSSTAAFAEAVPILRATLERERRDPTHYPISKRVFIAVDERPNAARAELDRWFTTVYRNPALTESAGIYGTPERVAERLHELVATGANHLLLNPVSRDLEQLEALAAIVGLG
jgi:alkanesulfonate monooxygenase SsuD/methylene tetrahydromethanopterin reductase-like flavin-dependent oxidoreductase (luciferase family)